MACRFSDYVHELVNNSKSERPESTHSTSLTGCDFAYSNFSLARLPSSSAVASDFTFSFFQKANCAGSSFAFCRLKYASFEEADLSHASFGFIRTHYSTKEDKTVYRPDFYGRLSALELMIAMPPIPKPINFIRAECSYAQFADCELDGSDFYSANLKGAKFVKL